jgi:hypothetical protein
MPNQIELLQEAVKRGLALPPEKQRLYDEAVKRGLVPGTSPQPAAAESPAVQGNPDYWGTGDQALDTLTFGGSTKLRAAGKSVLDATADAVQGKGWDYSTAYGQNLEQERANKQAYNKQNPIRSGLGTAGGVVLGVGTLPSAGPGLMGAVGTGAGYGAGYGAMQDADTWGERAQNTYEGARTGVGLGVLGYGAGKGLQWLGGKTADAWKAWRATPELAGQQKVFREAEKIGMPKVQQKMKDLGPDAVVADALGQRGGSMGRRAANLDPDAREIIADTLAGRKSQQNVRVLGDMEKIAGVTPGKEQTVKQLLDAVDDQFRPELDRLYTQARKTGKDIPIQYFDDVLTTKHGKAVYNEALEAVTSRAKLNGTPNEISNLAIIDEMKKIFDSKATVAFAGADKASGGLYADFAKNLRLRADALFDQMDDPIYKQARTLAQKAQQAKDAVLMGEKLGASRVPVDLPGKAQGVDPSNKGRVAQGYVAKKGDTLLNRGSTEGALTELSTPMGKRGADAALGPGSLDPTLARERTFNATNRQLVGNSTTAQQLMDDGGMSMLTQAITSPVRAARDFAGYFAGKIATEKQKAMAPVVAKVLMSNTLPTSPPIPPTVMEKMLNAADEKAAKALLLTWERQAPKSMASGEPTPSQKRLIVERLEEGEQ